MTAFINNSITYVDAKLVDEHLDLLEVDGYITYHHPTSAIPDTISKSLLEVYKDHLNTLRHSGPAFRTHETCTPSGNYFMICKMDDVSLAAGKADVKQKSNSDADAAGTAYDYPSR